MRQHFALHLLGQFIIASGLQIVCLIVFMCLHGRHSVSFYCTHAKAGNN
uniref:Uncharacterized protein n=1 Tax=Rhizophora mucronata TaxID=61149 RepID=A0A2P2QJ37_RHIMU